MEKGIGRLQAYCFDIFCFWMVLSQRRKVVDKKKERRKKNQRTLPVRSSN